MPIVTIVKELYLFIRQFFSSPTAIGSLVPSSKKLALCIAEKSAASSTPKKYLEVGGGSGALTHHLVNKLLAEDRLDVVEVDSNFCVILRAKFGHLKNVTIHEVSILDFEGENYDALVSSLPLNAFRAYTVSKILKKYERLVRKGGHLSYFEYLGIETLKQAFLFGKPASDFKDMVVLKRQFALKYGKESDKIWWNFPPARVIHCQM